MSNPENTTDITQAVPSSLPARVADLRRNTARQRSIYDEVEESVFGVGGLYDNSEDFRNLLNAVRNEDAVEGKLIYDDCTAAQMIRSFAPDGSRLKTQTVATLCQSLSVVMRRWGISRKDRRRGLELKEIQSSPENDVS